MRAGELLGARVRDRDDRPGRVIDIHARREAGGALVVDGLVVGATRARLLGFQHDRARGPVLLRALLRRLHRRTRYVEWRHVELAGGTVRLRCRWNDLPDTPPG